MRPSESFLGQPIRALQAMLRVIAKASGHRSPLIPDGIYGAATAKAVSDFQRSHDLPVTGITDLATWEAVFSCYEPARIGISPAHPVHILLDANQIIDSGDNHPHLFLIQGMLMVLSRQYTSIPQPGMTGRLDKATGDSLKAFQGLCKLQITGTLDKITWKHLALQYPLAACLQASDSSRKSRSCQQVYTIHK